MHAYAAIVLTTRNDLAFPYWRVSLRAQDERFLRGLSEKMCTYALGRIIEPTDRALIDSLVQQMKSNGNTLASLIEGIVLSDEFLTK